MPLSAPRLVALGGSAGGLVLKVFMNADQDLAVGVLATPAFNVADASGDRRREAEAHGGDLHWRWRLRAAERMAITTTLVANQFVQTPPSRYIRLLQVRSGFDVADNEIVKQLSAGDLVITGDIPLANEVLSKFEGLDMAEALTELKNLESQYNAALQMGARLLPKTLLDFLR